MSCEKPSWSTVEHDPCRPCASAQNMDQNMDTKNPSSPSSSSLVSVVVKAFDEEDT